MYLGIEIGGTKLQLGLGAGDGHVAALRRGAVVPAQGAAGIRAQITRFVPELLGQAGVSRQALRGVGIGFGGPVDDATRTVIKSHQIEGWDNFPLADWIGQLVGLPAVLGNDADVAGLGEALFGAARGFAPVFYITVGSGIGGGLIIDGKIYRGIGRGAAEIGHLRLDDGNRSDLLEHFASGWAIARRAEQLCKAGQVQDVVLLDAAGRQAVTGQLVAEAATRGDPGAMAALDFAWRQLARGICHVVALLCPRRIVIGGGVALMGEELFFRPVRELVAAEVFRPFADCYEIVPAALGEEVVVHGALALARQAEIH